MSTRFYPRFVKGNPQLRIFLPDWKMILIKPDKPMPNNTVTFKVDPKMTDWDIKNYLEKIYKVKVAGINSQIKSGKLRRVMEGIGLTKDEDYKISCVTLPHGQTFEWPQLFPSEKFDELKKEYDTSMKELGKGREIDPNVKIPSWFL